MSNQQSESNLPFTPHIPEYNASIDMIVTENHFVPSRHFEFINISGDDLSPFVDAFEILGQDGDPTYNLIVYMDGQKYEISNENVEIIFSPEQPIKPDFINKVNNFRRMLNIPSNIKEIISNEYEKIVLANFIDKYGIVLDVHNTGYLYALDMNHSYYFHMLMKMICILSDRNQNIIVYQKLNNETVLERAWTTHYNDNSKECLITPKYLYVLAIPFLVDVPVGVDKSTVQQLWQLPFNSK